MLDWASEEPLWAVGELLLPTRVVLLALKLENKGLRLRREGELLRVTDPSAPDGRPSLCDYDLASIRNAKLHLLQLVDYCMSDHQKAQQPKRNRSAQRNGSQQRNTAVQTPIESGVNGAQQSAQHS